jgi:hypothetical protein
VWINGKQERLDPDKDKAFDKFHKRMANKEINAEVAVARSKPTSRTHCPGCRPFQSPA